MEDFGAQFYFSIAATSFLQFYFSIAATSFLQFYFSIATTSLCNSTLVLQPLLPEHTFWNTTLVLQPIERGMLLSKWATN